MKKRLTAEQIQALQEHARKLLDFDHRHRRHRSGRRLTLAQGVVASILFVTALLLGRLLLYHFIAMANNAPSVRYQ